MLKDQLNADLKTAMIARDQQKVEVLRGLKSAILYEEVAKTKRDVGLSDDEILTVLARESKKRQEAAGLFKQGGNLEKSADELAEKVFIDAYLPTQFTEEELNTMIDSVILELGLTEITNKDMGRIISSVRSTGGAKVDGALLAKLVSARISK